MALREIMVKGEPCLSKVCHPVTEFNKKLHDLLEKNAAAETQVDLAALPGLVLFAEDGCFDTGTVSAYIRSQVSRTDYSACVLGCTHFTYFRDSMRLVFPDAELKIFMTADPMVRAQRRAEEMAAKGMTLTADLLRNLDQDNIIQ